MPRNSIEDYESQDVYSDYRLGGYGRIDQDELFKNSPGDIFIEYSGGALMFLIIVLVLIQIFH